MRIRLQELRSVIRKVILESEEERVYDDTVLPGELADDDLLAEPDLTDQEERDNYVNTKSAQLAKKKRARLQSRSETQKGTSDEHAIVGHIGPLGASGNGPGTKPYGKQKKLRSRNAMGSKSIEEHDE